MEGGEPPSHNFTFLTNHVIFSPMQTAFQGLSLNYLKLLARQYPNISAASREIINLSAILNLPKGTEHFVTDVHGEYEAFLHVLKNGSGVIRRKIDDIFSESLPEGNKSELAALIYYPEQRMALILKDLPDQEEWFRITLFRLVKMCRVLSSKYTRSKVRKALPEDFSYIIEELLHEQEGLPDKQEYYKSILGTIIATGRAEAFITALAELIQRLAVDHLHVIGDIYDRGPGAHIIMDRLLHHHGVDFQWGNHDLSWMGAAAGCQALVANVIRISLRYTTMTTIEDGYAISLLPLATFAMEIYADDPAIAFQPRLSGERSYSQSELQLIARMQKAIYIIQQKLEGQIIARRPQFKMEDRNFLHTLDKEEGAITIEGQTSKLTDQNFPTVDPSHPYDLTPGEKSVIEKLTLSFRNSEKLQKHMRLLWSKGSLYLVRNNTLLYHGCIPLNEEGGFVCFEEENQRCFTGRDFLDHMEMWARQGAFNTEDLQKRSYGQDVIWYLWTGPLSPVFGKKKMATFERYFIQDETTHKEVKNPYYKYRDQEETAKMILKEFGVTSPHGRIVNGHVPVKVSKGESPIKAGGRLLVIDGGFSKAYQKETGIAGYTLIYNSYGFLLSSHQPFVSAQTAIEEAKDLDTKTEILENNYTRIRIRDTDNGKELQEKIKEISILLHGFQEGILKEN